MIHFISDSMFTSIGLIMGAALLPRWLLPNRRPDAAAAIKMFHVKQSELKSAFFEAAAQSGMPRGLRWVRCDFADEVHFGRDEVNNDIIALIPITVGFEAIEGGPMEDVEAVGNLRAATAIFAYNKDAWNATGKTVFNLPPADVFERFADQLIRIETEQ